MALNISKTLNQVKQSCEEITQREEERLRQMPKSETCVHSKVPEGRTYCDYFEKCCISYCEICEHFENR